MLWRPLLLSALLVGCSAPVDEAEDVRPDDSPRASSEDSRATVSVEQLEVGGTTRLQASARFVRVAGDFDHDTADQIIGAPQDMHMGCRVVDDDASLGPSLDDRLDQRGSIELLDVGELTLDEITLAARAFPDVGELISGVVYTSRGELSRVGEEAELPSDGGRMWLNGSGNADFEEFSLAIDAPAAPADVTIGYEQVPLSEVSTIASGVELPLEWSADEDGDSHIRVVLAGDDDVVSCGFVDDGAAIVPAAFLHNRSGPAELSVHRLRRTRSQLAEMGVAEGAHIDGAVIELDFAVASHVIIE